MPEPGLMNGQLRARTVEQLIVELERTLKTQEAIREMLDLRGQKLLKHIEAIKERGAKLGKPAVTAEDQQLLRDIFYEISWVTDRDMMKEMAKSQRDGRQLENEHVYATRFFESNPNPKSVLAEALNRLGRRARVIEEDLLRLGHTAEAPPARRAA